MILAIYRDRNTMEKLASISVIDGKNDPYFVEYIGQNKDGTDYVACFGGSFPTAAEAHNAIMKNRPGAIII